MKKSEEMSHVDSWEKGKLGFALLQGNSQCNGLEVGAWRGHCAGMEKREERKKWSEK